MCCTVFVASQLAGSHHTLYALPVCHPTKSYTLFILCSIYASIIYDSSYHTSKRYVKCIMIQAISSLQVPFPPLPYPHPSLPYPSPSLTLSGCHWLSPSNMTLLPPSHCFCIVLSPSLMIILPSPSQLLNTRKLTSSTRLPVFTTIPDRTTLLPQISSNPLCGFLRPDRPPSFNLPFSLSSPMRFKLVMFRLVIGSKWVIPSPRHGVRCRNGV